MSLIKNRTPYLGKIKLKFQKDPYVRGGGLGILNTVHLNLGFTKLVSRIYPIQSKVEGYLVDPEKVKLINNFTGGIIDSIYLELGVPKEEFTLHNSFLTKNRIFVGDIERAWWYYTNQLGVCEDFPHGVAIKYNENYYYGLTTTTPQINDIIGYYGYTHRGGSLFKIGDRLFDVNYKPIEDDYEEWEWEGWVDKFNERLEKADDFDKKWLSEDGISAVIPFKKRGKKLIENLEEAKQAAINMSNYLS